MAAVGCIVDIHRHHPPSHPRPADDAAADDDVIVLDGPQLHTTHDLSQTLDKHTLNYDQE